MKNLNTREIDYTMDCILDDIDFANTYSETVLNAVTLEQVCDAYTKVDNTIKERIAQRQAETKALKQQVESIEKPYRPVIKNLEHVKSLIHQEISKRVLDDRRGKTCKVGTLTISETTPKRTYEPIDLKKVPLEFIQINHEAIDHYVELFGVAPEGILMCETRQCRIVNKKD